MIFLFLTLNRLCIHVTCIFKSNIDVFQSHIHLLKSNILKRTKWLSYFLSLGTVFWFVNKHVICKVIFAGGMFTCYSTPPTANLQDS